MSSKRCTVPPPGWACTRKPGHEGPCAAVGIMSPEELLIRYAECSRERDALCEEIRRAMDVLKPNVPASGLEDACRQVKQAQISAAGNCETLEQLLEIFVKQLKYEIRWCNDEDCFADVDMDLEIEPAVCERCLRLRRILKDYGQL